MARNEMMSGNGAAVRGGGDRSRRHRNQQRGADLFSGPSFNNVRRGTRMNRVRRASLDALAFPILHVPPLPPPRVRYLFNKELKNSDVSTLRRMVLPKKEAETHLPNLDTKEGISFSMLDMDGIHEWLFKYRYWPNNSSRMYVLESTGDFVLEHDLLPGDYILVYRNSEDGRYMIEGRKKEEHEARTGIYNDIVINEATIDLNLAVSEDNMDMLYEYNATFMDDSPFEYIGDPINLPSLESRPFCFEPIENYSAEDFQFQMI
ncbi:hypothetical protein BUALT_Bualt04G0179100 [Buddleja alternifolia]|uniref:TF-B3 domain-containing protein n=1 Tax=Buddleja alternifolia TaxID=168488 RepID=A0AAV6XWK1_9LAMI|nr:hypothetical protein BUALT_Bualt04G0179100 [Buddleja alternifolia]